MVRVEYLLRALVVVCVLDATGVLVTTASTVGFQGSPLDWGAMSNFETRTTDLCLVLAVRILTVLAVGVLSRVALPAVDDGTPEPSQAEQPSTKSQQPLEGSGRSESSSIAPLDGTAAVAVVGTGNVDEHGVVVLAPPAGKANSKAVVVNVADGDDADTSVSDRSPLLLTNGTAPTTTATATAKKKRPSDEFEWHRARARRRIGRDQHKFYALAVCFVVLNACNVYVSMKSLHFRFEWKPWAPLLTALTVLWVNMEFVLLRAVVNKWTSETDVAESASHQHPLLFVVDVTFTHCDVCTIRVEKEGFRCDTCDFDLCIPCFRKAAATAAAAARAKRTGRGGAPRPPGAPPAGRPVANGIDGALPDLSVTEYIRRALKMTLPFRGYVVTSLVCLAATQGARIALPSYQGKVIDSVIARDRSTFWFNVLHYIGFSAATLIMGSLKSYAVQMVFRNVSFTLRRLMFQSLINRDVAFFDSTSVGALSSRMTNDASATAQPVPTLINTVFANVIILVGSLGMCLVVSWRLALISFTVVGPIVFITGTYARWSRRINRRIFDSLSQASNVATQAFTNVRTVKAFSTEAVETTKFSENMNDALQKAKRSCLASSGTFALTSFLDFGSMALILLFGGLICMEFPDELSVGNLVTFQLYANMMNSAYQGLNGVLNTFTSSASAAARVLAMLDSVPSIDPTVGEEFSPLCGDLALEGVTFAYASRADVPVLRNLSLRMPRNAVTAIVGKSGGGKSTIMNLLLRLYDPVSGRVTVDGRDIRSLSLRWLHKHMAVVSQETQLFALPIEANISYGSEGYTQAQLQEAARLAHAEEFIDRFEDGYATTVGERGVLLSGGQRQRIAIARALLRKPRILLLDEATSALDSQSEALVQEALDALIGDLTTEGRGCTIVVVAHRLSTVMRADNIIVLGDDGVLEQGRHAELLERGGPYARLVATQLQQPAAVVAAAAAAAGTPVTPVASPL